MQIFSGASALGAFQKTKPVVFGASTPSAALTQEIEEVKAALQVGGIDMKTVDVTADIGTRNNVKYEAIRISMDFTPAGGFNYNDGPVRRILRHNMGATENKGDLLLNGFKVTLGFAHPDTFSTSTSIFQ